MSRNDLIGWVIFAAALGLLAVMFFTMDPRH